MDATFLKWLEQQKTMRLEEAARAKETFFRVSGAVQMLEHIQGYCVKQDEATSPPRPTRKRKGK